MKRKHIIALLLTLVLTSSLILAGCGTSPLTESEIAGDYGTFFCDSDGLVEVNSDGYRYVSMRWKLIDPEEGKVEFTYEITDANLECYAEDFWEELGGREPTEEDIWDNFEYLREEYDIPSDGYYFYDRDEKELESDETGAEYYKKD